MCGSVNNMEDFFRNEIAEFLNNTECEDYVNLTDEDINDIVENKKMGGNE